MSDENLGDVLNKDYQAHKREVAVKNLGKRTHLTLEKLAQLVGHKDHGETVKDITLQELIDVRNNGVASAPDPSTPAPARAAPKKAAKKSGTTGKASAAKAPAAKKAAKKAPAAKKAAKKAAAKKTTKTTKKGPKADKGKPKPRLDYEVGKREVLAAIKAADEPVGRGDIEKATGYTGVQVRTFAKALAAESKIEILGDGGRSTKYAPPGYVAPAK